MGFLGIGTGVVQGEGTEEEDFPGRVQGSRGPRVARVRSRMNQAERRVAPTGIAVHENIMLPSS